MRRITAGICLVAGVVSSGVPPALSEDAVQVESALIDQATLPDAIDSKGARPKADPSVISPAVDALPPPLLPLAAPPSLALPDAPSQVRIHELRPLTLEESLQLAEVNSPQLKAAASRVDQAKSGLRAAIAAWYPTVDLSASGLPEYFKSYSYRNPDFVTNNETYGRQWRVNGSLQVSWDLINPARVPQIAAARDRFERAGDSYLIALRDLRLEVQTAYFALQQADVIFLMGAYDDRWPLIDQRVALRTWLCARLVAACALVVLAVSVNVRRRAGGAWRREALQPARALVNHLPHAAASR
ncbi:MAG: TolC family protein, partial [Synechococcus sp.]